MMKPVDQVTFAAAVVMAMPVGDRMAMFATVATLYRRVLIDEHPQATKIQIREQTRAFGFAVLHRLQSIVPDDVDGWCGG